MAGLSGTDLVREIASASAHLAAELRTARPFLVSRFGNTEMKAVSNWWAIERARRRSNPIRAVDIVRGLWPFWRPELLSDLRLQAGVFPVDPRIAADFCQVYEDSVPSIDVIGIWGVPGEAEVLDRRSPSARRFDIEAIQPLKAERSWLLELEGARALVVHPFRDSILRQYERHDTVFRGRRVLPHFSNLDVVPAVMSFAGANPPFRDWFEALESMKEAIAAHHFDVAIIGAGAYGLPLGAFVKSLGKQAVHLGGSSQLLFGILGKRWESDPLLMPLINDDWGRPDDAEAPPKAAEVEEGCYW